MAVDVLAAYSGENTAYPGEVDKFTVKWSTLETGETISTCDVVFLDDSASNGASIGTIEIDSEYTTALITTTTTSSVMECLYTITTSEGRTLKIPVHIHVSADFFGK